MRAPFQILVLPFRSSPNGGLEFAAFRCADSEFWQFIAGGGEDQESPLQAAKREAREEAGLPDSIPFYPLQSSATVPVTAFPTSTTRWIAEGIYVVPEHAFAAKADGVAIRLSSEHTEFRWGSEAETTALLEWDSNRNALWELSQRLSRNTLD
ncbi:MAG: NUDIX pyrophosphatase [Candidatus Coatesbacteria bacterium]